MENFSRNKAKIRQLSKSNYDEGTKEEKILYHKKRLNRQFARLDKKTKNIVSALIDNAAFMTVTLEELQAKITREGITTTYQNGENQWGTKKSPEAEMYNTMIKNLSTITKQLSELVPRDLGESNDDGFDDFIISNV